MSATTKPISHRQLYSPPPRFFFGPHARLSTAHSRILQQRFANCSRAPGCRDANARGVSELKDRPLHALLFSSMSCQSQSFLPKEEQWERKRGGGGGAGKDVTAKPRVVVVAAALPFLIITKHPLLRFIHPPVHLSTSWDDDGPRTSLFFSSPPPRLLFFFTPPLSLPRDKTGLMIPHPAHGSSKTQSINRKARLLALHREGGTSPQ